MIKPNTLKKLICILGFLSLFSSDIFAQYPAYTFFYRQNWQWVNPAAMDRWAFFLNRNNSTSIVSGSFRQQWILKNLGNAAPQTWFASYEYAPGVNSRNRPNVRLGAMGFGDQTDATSTYGLRGNFSYYIQSRDDFFHFGISAGARSFQINGSLVAQDGGDPLVQRAESGDLDRIHPDFAFGFLYRKGTSFYTGISVPQTFTSIPNGDNADIKRVMPVYFLIGGFLELGDRDYGQDGDHRVFTIEPSIWLRYASNTTYYTIFEQEKLLLSWLSMSGDVRVHYRGVLWVGAGYGTNQMANVEFGISKKFNDDTRGRVGFNYSLPVGNSFLNLGHSFEITAALGLK